MSHDNCAFATRKKFRDLCFLKHHANVMQSGNEAAAVNLAAAGCPVTETDDVGATLAKSGSECELLGVVGKRNKPGFTVAIITHEDCEFPACGEDTGTVTDESSVACKKCR